MSLLNKLTKSAELPINPLAPPPEETPKAGPVTFRDFGDADATRNAIYTNVLDAARNMPPVSNTRYTLSLHDVDYEDPEHISLKRQKELILRGESAVRRLRGTWALHDLQGTEIERKRSTLAQVPYMTQRGTFIINGTQNTLKHQMRLDPGVYTRMKENGDLEAHANTKIGKGLSHRYNLEPATGIFKMDFAQASLPIVPVLRAFGTTDEEMRQAWGNELYAANIKKSDPRVIDKLYQRLVRKGSETDAPADKVKAVVEAFQKMEFDPEVNRRTLGAPYKNLDKNTIFAITKKLLAVNRGEVESDDRDHLAYQHFMGPEDTMAERLRRPGLMLHQLLWKASTRGSLKSLPVNAFDRHLRAAIQDSGLGQNLEDVNPAEWLDQQHAVTRLGVGGISSADAVPDEARSVLPSHVGYLDLVKTPESVSAGVESRVASGVRKGSDGRVYAPYTDPKTGEVAYKNPQQVSGMVLAFPNEMETGESHVAALVNGKTRYVPKESVDLVLPHAEKWFSPISSLISHKNSSKGQRVSMGARFITQALPLVNAEAPLVRTQVPGMPGLSFAEHFGKHFGAINAHNQPGEVVSVAPDEIVVKYADGSQQTHELYNNAPNNRKTLIHNTPVVQQGDRISPNQLLARSNYTDDKGHLALGLNLRTAYMSWGGKNFEDAVSISEAAAKRLSSEHLYQHQLDFDPKQRRGKKEFISIFANKFDKKTLENIDDRGFIKPGSTVKFGDPVVLAATERPASHKTVHASHKGSFSDSTLLWEHHEDGIVTDVVDTPKGVAVAVKTLQPMKIGDKLAGSWGDKGIIGHVIPDEEMPRDPVSGKPYEVLANPLGIITRSNPSQMLEAWLGKIAAKTGKPYVVEDFQNRDSLAWVEEELKKNGLESMDEVEDPSTGRRIKVGTGVRHYMKLHHQAENKGQGRGLGSYTSDEAPSKTGGQVGSCFAAKQPIVTIDGLVDISRICEKRLGVPVRTFCEKTQTWTYRPVVDWFTRRARVSELVAVDLADNNSLLVTGNHEVFTTVQSDIAEPIVKRPVSSLTAGDCLVTWGPLLSAVQSQLMYGSLLGDASVTATGFTCEHSVNQLAWIEWKQNILSGLSATVFGRGQRSKSNMINGEVVKSKLSKILHVGWRHIVDPMRRLCYSGEAEKKTITDLWLSKLGPLSVVAWLLDDGSITGLRATETRSVKFSGSIATHGFSPVCREKLASWLSDFLGVKCTSRPYGTIFLPAEACRRLVPLVAEWIPRDVIPGSKFLLKELVEVIQQKTPARSVSGISRLSRVPVRIKSIRPYKHDKPDVDEINVYDFTVEDTHVYCAGSVLVSNSKRLSSMDIYALLSSGATGVLRDARLIRGQKNQEYWAARMAGFSPPSPTEPLVYRKFIDHLRGSGINVRRSGSKLHLMALTDKHIDELAENREILNNETVDWRDGLKPIKGGFFDPALTGSHGGNKWAFIRLYEPMPSPVFEEPIRHLLKLTGKQFEGVLAGKEKLDGKTGPSAIHDALANIRVKPAIVNAQTEIKSSRKGVRDAAVRRLRYLKGLETQGLEPKDWMMTKVPVIPPIFRPVSQMQGGQQLVSDSNYLYKEVFDANKNLKELTGQVDDVSEERMNLYNSFKAVTGLGDPVQPKNQERKVKGLLGQVFSSSPKYGMLQRKLLGTTMDLVGRAVISPNPDLSMDEIGIPEGRAWEVYSPFLVRRLVRQGMGRVQALDAVEGKNKLARKAMIEEMDERPVMMSRAPVLHRFGRMAFFPRLVKGDVMHVSPLVVKGYGADFDGDAANYEVIADDDAAKEAAYKLLPSRNLTAVSDFKKPMHQPSNEYIAGLHAATATTNKTKRPRVFATKKDAMRAWHNGELDPDDQVEIVDENG